MSSGTNIYNDNPSPIAVGRIKFDISQIRNDKDIGNSNCTILTTEKDYIRLESLISNKIKFIKSDLQIVDEDKFNNLILNI